MSAQGATARTAASGGRRFTLSGVQRGLVLALVAAVTIPIFPAVVIGERGLTPFQAFAVLATGVGALRFALGEARVRGSWVMWSVLVFWAVATFSAVSLLVPEAPNSGRVDFLTTWAQLTLIVALVVAAGATVRYRDADVRRLAEVYVAVAAVVGLYALYQTIARLYGLPLAYLPILNPSLAGTTTRAGVFGGLVRPSGTFTEPGLLGSYLLTPLFLSVFLYRYVEAGRRRTLIFAAALCIASGLLVAFSLQAYFALLVAGAVGLLIRPVRTMMGRVVLYTGAIVAVLTLVSLAVLEEPFLELAVERALAALDRIVDVGYYGGSTIDARLERAEAALAVWAEHPLFGVGVNNWGRFYPAGMAQKVHGAFVQALAEMGPLGPLTLFGAVFGSGAALLAKLRTVGELGWREAVIGAVGVGLVARGARMLVASNYLSPFFALDMLIAALLIGWIGTARNPGPEGGPARNPAGGAGGDAPVGAESAPD